MKKIKISKIMKALMNNITEYYPFYFVVFLAVYSIVTNRINIMINFVILPVFISFYFLISFRKEILTIRKVKEEINSTRLDLKHEIEVVKEIRNALLNIQILVPESQEQQVEEIMEKEIRKRIEAM